MAQQYTPGDGPVRYQYVVNRMREGATRTHAEQEYTRWLAAHDARVRRDAEAELDSWMTRAYEAEGKLWKAEARIRHLEATAQVLVKEALDAENARDESRRGKVEAEARIKAVQHVLDRPFPPRARTLAAEVRCALDGA